MINLSDVRAAREAIAGPIRQTPVFHSGQLGRRVGTRLWLKAESFQKTGSFKSRGALNRLRQTPRDDLDRGVITVSAGNHAQGVAWAASQVNAACTVVMLDSASPTKVAATRGYGADVVLVPGGGDAAFVRMGEIQRERGLVLVHPFDDPLVIAGQGTVGLEILEQVPDADAIVVPVGGGGLISGIAVAAKTLKPGIRVYGVEPTGAAKMRRSWDEGHAVRLDHVDTIADGLAPPMAGQLTYPITRRYVDDIVTISDDVIAFGLRDLMTYAKLYVEPAGAAATGALLAGAIPIRPGETVVAVVSGGNLDLDRLPGLL